METCRSKRGKQSIKRGSQNQDLRKEKGHATEEDIAAGISNEEDQKVNDKSEKLAGDGVGSINGKGLVELGRWIAK